MNYKKVKFSIELSDCELVTRNGHKVIWGGYNNTAINRHRICGWVGDVLMSWDEKGRFTGTEEESNYDLFALVETEIGFINIHEDSHGKWADERIYDYRGVAEENGRLSPTYLTTLEIEL